MWVLSYWIHAWNAINCGDSHLCPLCVCNYFQCCWFCSIGGMNHNASLISQFYCFFLVGNNLRNGLIVIPHPFGEIWYWFRFIHILYLKCGFHILLCYLFLHVWMEHRFYWMNVIFFTWEPIGFPWFMIFHILIFSIFKALSIVMTSRIKISELTKNYMSSIMKLPEWLEMAIYTCMSM